MPFLTSKEYMFKKIVVNRVSFPTESLIEVITPELEDPYWEFVYGDTEGNPGDFIFATGEVTIQATLRKSNLKLVEGVEQTTVRRLKRRGEEETNET